ncbi:MAG: hypothetical protein ABIG64_02395 [Candidatus Omnitrophota bacterium]
MQDFIEKGIIYNQKVDDYIEENYFEKNPFLKIDFSNGLSYFAAPDSKNKFSISKDDFFSFFQSLKISALELPCRLYFCKNKGFSNLKYLPWGFENNPTWLGIIPNSQLHLKLYYKGAGPVIYINLLEKSGAGRILISKDLKCNALDWEKVELSEQLPLSARAIQLEITLNSSDFGTITYIDDISLQIIK